MIHRTKNANDLCIFGSDSHETSSKISAFGKIDQATVVLYFQGGVGSFDGVLYPVIMTAKYFD